MVEPLSDAPAPTLKQLRDQVNGEVKKNITGYEAMHTDLVKALQATQRDNFLNGLSPKDQALYKAFSPDIDAHKYKGRNRNPSGIHNLNKTIAVQHFLRNEGAGMDEQMAQFHFETLQQKYAALQDVYSAQREVLSTAMRDGRKQLYHTEDGKTLLMQFYDAELADSHKRLGWFDAAIKKADSPANHVHKRNPISPENFAKALENKGSGIGGLNPLVKQAHEIADFEGKPLAEVINERLTVSGLKPQQVEMLTGVAQAFEKGEHKAHLAQLRLAHPVSTVSPAEPKSPSTPASAAKAETEAKAESWVNKFKNLKTGQKTAIIGGSVALAAILGYWAFKAKQSDQGRQQSAVAH